MLIHEITNLLRDIESFSQNRNFFFTYTLQNYRVQWRIYLPQQPLNNTYAALSTG